MIEFVNDATVAEPEYWKVHAMQAHLAFAVADVETAGRRLVSAGAVGGGSAGDVAGRRPLLMLRDPGVYRSS